MGSDTSARAFAIAAFLVATRWVPRFGVKQARDRGPAQAEDPAVLVDVGLEAVAEDRVAVDRLGPRQVVGADDVDVVATQVERGEVVAGQAERREVGRHVVHDHRWRGLTAARGQEAVEPGHDPHRAGGAVHLDDRLVAEAAAQLLGRRPRGCLGGAARDRALAGGRRALPCVVVLLLAEAGSVVLGAILRRGRDRRLVGHHPGREDHGECRQESRRLVPDTPPPTAHVLPPDHAGAHPGSCPDALWSAKRSRARPERSRICLRAQAGNDENDALTVHLCYPPLAR